MCEKRNKTKWEKTYHFRSFRSFNGGLNTKRIRFVILYMEYAESTETLMRYDMYAIPSECFSLYTHTHTPIRTLCLTLYSHERTALYTRSSVHTRVWHINSVWTLEMSNCVGGLSILCAVIRVRHRKIEYFWRKTHTHAHSKFFRCSVRT